MTASKIIGIEELIELIPQLQGSDFGGFAKEAGHAGTREDPIPWPHVEYKDGIDRLVEDAIYKIVYDNPELGLKSYSDILDENGLEWSDESLRVSNVSELDIRCLLAMVLAIVRGDRFCDGLLLAYMENGLLLSWLERIQELTQDRC